MNVDPEWLAEFHAQTDQLVQDLMHSAEDKENKNPAANATICAALVQDMTRRLLVRVPEDHKVKWRVMWLHIKIIAMALESLEEHFHAVDR